MVINKIILAIISFSLLIPALTLPPPVAAADCVDPVNPNVASAKPSCAFSSLPYSCIDASNFPVACCSKPVECPFGTKAVAVIPTPDPTATAEVWCSGQVGYIKTGIGCIHASDPKSLIAQVATWAIGIASGVALITIAYSGFLIVTAQGDVKKVNEAKTFLMSALFGLLLIAIALVILNFVGVKILGLNEFGFST